MKLLLFLALAQPLDELQRHRNLGTAYYERGEYAAAVDELETAVGFDAAIGRDYFHLGMAYLQNQQPDRALAAFTTAKQMEPALIEADFGLGVLHKRALRYPLALESLRKVAARDPTDPCTAYNIGAVFAAMDRPAEAEGLFRSVVDLGWARGENFYVSALFRYATLLARRGLRDEARRYFAEFQELREKTPNIALTETALENGRYAKVAPHTGPAPPLERSGGGLELDATEEVLLEAGCESGVTIGDYDADGRIDVFVTVPCGEDRLFRNLGGRFEDVTKASGLSGSREGRGAAFLDDDNDGLPSLYVWRASSHHFYGRRGALFEEATSSSELGTVAPPSAALVQDLDNDGQVDLLLSGPGRRLELVRNRGDGSFAVEAAIEIPGELRGMAAADFAMDGFADLVGALDSGEALLLDNRAGTLHPSILGGARLERVEVVDVDHDGWFDVVASGSGGASQTFSNRGGRLYAVSRPVPGDAGSVPSIDLDGDGFLARLISGADGRIRILRSRGADPSSFLRLTLEGKRTNRSGLGATVELKAGRFYRKRIYPGHPLTVATGGRERLDVLRVTWTNGVIQNLVDVDTRESLQVLEDDRQTSSCPFLYVWDGERFRFLTDIVGRAPLGEVLPDGSVLTPNPEDVVRIPRESMQPKDGRIVLQITEELRELAHLDAVELLAVDRPVSVEVYANERLSSPPFEPHRWYAVAERAPPLDAANHREEDVLRLLEEPDGVYVSDFQRDRVPGFAEEHGIVLSPPEFPGDEPLWLLLSGWVYWPSSSSMKAISSGGRLLPMGPRLEVKDASGSWVTVIPDLGLPSGIDRTLVADLSGVFLSSDRRVRIVTNFAVSWDFASFARPADGATVASRPLRPAAADLHYRGFSAVAREHGKPEEYHYDRLLPEAPWNAASGLYTRYGDVVALVSDRDGKLVVMAPGDELTLTFDATGVPEPPEGYERDYFLHVTGWAKDQDPHTLFSTTVEPLPVTSKDGPERTRPVPALVPPLSLPAPGRPSTGTPVEEREASSLWDALTGGDPSVSLRYRYELVEDEGFEETARASTLRTALGYRTLAYHRFSVFLEAQSVVALGAERYDNRGAGELANGVSGRPAVVDPEQTRLQQGYLRLEALDTEVDVGRREIAHGDHRFIGDVSWRQNHQAFEGVHVVNRSLPKTTLAYTFADLVLRIDGGTKEMSSHFANALFQVHPLASLELFAYLLDYEAAADEPLSTQSYGGKLSLRAPVGGGKRLLFETQYAKQLDFGSNPAERNADYLHVVGGFELEPMLTVELGRELLGGSLGGGSFQTPLATLFKLNGWADKFLTTPPLGLVDWYLRAQGKLRSFSWVASYHDFSAAAGGAPYGREVDLRASVAAPWKQLFGAQLALYRQEGFATDASKLWLFTEQGF